MSDPEVVGRTRVIARWNILIMAVVLGFLAAIFVPALVPGRQRQSAIASTILNEARQIDAAKHSETQARGLTGTNAVTFTDLTPYLKAGSKLAMSGGSDSLGNAFILGDVSTQIRVSPATKSSLSPSTGGDTFWGPYS